MNHYEILLDRIEQQKAVLGVIGLGYVGLPLAVSKAQAGYQVIGFDIDQQKVDAINQGNSYIADVATNELAEQVNSGRLVATTDFSRLKNIDAVSICVPTPIDPYKQPVLSHILQAVWEIVSHSPERILVILSSTTYPGTTEEVITPMLEQTGKKIGETYFLAYSPERIDPGSAYQIKKIPRVVGGMTPQCTKLAAALYQKVLQDQLFEVESPAIAEMAKIVENTFRLVNIGLMNELAILCHRMQIDIWKVIEAASTKPYGFLPFYPGPGIGGHCIPVDPYYLVWKAKKYNFTTHLIEKAGEINQSMPAFVVFRMTSILNDYGKPMKGAKVLILGAAYKKNVPDLRESPVLEIMELLTHYGVEWEYHDPYVSEIFRPEQLHKSTPLTEASLKNKDLVLIATDHDQIDYELVAEHAPAIFDTRNAMSQMSCAGDYFKL